MTKKVTEKEILRIFESLPKRENGGLSSRQEPLVLSLSLELTMWRTGTRIGSLPALKSGTPKQGVRQLRKIEKAINDLMEGLSQLNATPHEALLDAREDLDLSWTASTPVVMWTLLDEHYPGLRDALLLAQEKITRSEKIPKRGRHPNDNVHRLMSRLADVYFLYTGKRPARKVDPLVDGKDSEKGYFIDFVRQIFTLIGINDSPESRARWAINDFKSRHGNK